MTTLTKNQKRTYGPRFIAGYGKNAMITATVRYDDECGNGHNTFAITAEIKAGRNWEAGGCLHEEIARVFPELEPFIKWHLCSSDGPMHYVANTVYHATEHGPTMAYVYHQDDVAGIRHHCVKYCSIEQAEAILAQSMTYSMEIDQKTAKVANLDYARSSAIWPEATREQLLDRQALEARLPALLEEFRSAVESLGFTF